MEESKAGMEECTVGMEGSILQQEWKGVHCTAGMERFIIVTVDKEQGWMDGYGEQMDRCTARNDRHTMLYSRNRFVQQDGQLYKRDE